MTTNVIVTGANGFLAGHLIPRLLDAGHFVTGIDNDSKYGPQSQREHPRYRHLTGSVQDQVLIQPLFDEADYIIANAARVGGVEYLGKKDGTIGLENSLISSVSLRAAIAAHRRNRRLRRYVAISSSMVFDQASHMPTAEGDELRLALPTLTYGAEKRVLESYVVAAGRAFDFPYTIIRPFNCVGIGETRAIDLAPTLSGDIRLVMGHVVPDLIHKILLGQNPLRILGGGGQRRHYTSVADVARGIQVAMESPLGLFQDFNIANDTALTVTQVAEMIWSRMKPGEPPAIQPSTPVIGDVGQRNPSTTKAKSLLGFSADESLEEILDDVIAWVTVAHRKGKL